MTEHEPGSTAWVRHQIMVDVGSDDWVRMLCRTNAHGDSVRSCRCAAIREAFEAGGAALARLRRVAVAARNLLDGWAVTLEDERLSYVEGQLAPEDIAALRAALDGAPQPEAKTELERAVRAYLDEYTAEGGVLLYGQRLDNLRAALDEQEKAK